MSEQPTGTSVPAETTTIVRSPTGTSVPDQPTTTVPVDTTTTVPATTTTVAVVETTVAPDPSALPPTGSEVGVMLVLAVSCAAVGGWCLRFARRG